MKLYVGMHTCTKRQSKGMGFPECGRTAFWKVFRNVDWGIAAFLLLTVTFVVLMGLKEPSKN
jgi:hypothetical protein